MYESILITDSLISKSINDFRIIYSIRIWPMNQYSLPSYLNE